MIFMYLSICSKQLYDTCEATFNKKWIYPVFLIVSLYFISANLYDNVYQEIFFKEEYLVIGQYVSAEIVSQIWDSYTSELIENKSWPKQCTDINKYLFNTDLEELDLINDNNFLSVNYVNQLGLRMGSDRLLEHVHIAELQDAIYKVVKKSNGITKIGCFKKVIELLGYNRVSDNSIKILEDALVFLKLDGKIVEKDECLFS